MLSAFSGQLDKNYRKKWSINTINEIKSWLFVDDGIAYLES